ncbi:MAG TPA: EscC/YscC/HrcC family type III secretion system outer membrane ring protein, partial [Candidatus Mailhella excrementigallinarum]|nr:EscC/YscC/HrcC family type III secretion system outer membrane ring protein [Candidatus Mailhella excrementigallinarum]
GEGVFPSAGAASDGGLSFSTLYSHGTDYFLARVNALEEDGQARVLGKPSVLTMDNVQATLENTSTYYIPVQGYESSDLFKIDSGTVLKVTPHIIPSENGGPEGIKLMVSVQDDRDDGSNSFSVDSSKGLSPIKQTKINTQAIVAEGQSLLIGGYYYETQSDSESGVPGLKNIPLLGGLFSSTGKKHQRMERLILITPRIVRMDQAPDVPARVDDPRFSRTPTQADYEERAPLARPVGGCARRAELAPAAPEPSLPPSVSVTPVSAPLPAGPVLSPMPAAGGGQ